MKLWLLRPIDPDGHGSLWEPWYDKAFGFIVRAETEVEARVFAQANAGDEAELWDSENRTRRSTEAWTSAEHSTCIELTLTGEPGVIMRDFASA